MQEEIWKDIPGYEGYYQASDLGNVRSLDRVVIARNGVPRVLKGTILRQNMTTSGYKSCGLCVNKINRTYAVHQLMAMTFLNHTPNRQVLVVDHINNVKTDNRLENLQLVTTRHNTTKDKTGTSKYTGVSWHKRGKKWKSCIRIRGSKISLGYFTDENDAALAYQNALKDLA